jgi:hypothetical protein
MDALYFSTVTMTTVGYGEINGKARGRMDDMMLVIVLQIVGILIFSVIKNNVFNVKKEITIHVLVKQRGDELTDFLNQLNATRKKANISEEALTETFEYVMNSVRYSTREYLHESEFWDDLPINL